MAHLVLSSAGTLGDFLPIIALGRELAARGHQVRLACDPSMAQWVEHAGLHHVPCGPPRGEQLVRGAPRLVDHWSDAGRAAGGGDEEREAQWNAIDLPGQFRDLRAACQGADLLVATSLQAAAPLVHEATGIPWVSVMLMPMQLTHADDPPRGSDEDPGRVHYRRWYRGVRAALGMAALDDAELAARQRAPLGLLASSLHFSQPRPEALAGIAVTGFWHFDASSWQQPGWTPDPSVVQFIEEQGPPLVLTLGSVAVEEPAAMLAVHARAAAAAGVPLLVQSGWAGLSAADVPGDVPPERVRVTGFLPHGWLLPRARAVIHHGGIGVTAQALRAGCPMIVEPWGSDQLFNAQRVIALGAGLAMHPHQLTVEGLRRALVERVLTAERRAHCRTLAARFADEDGLGVACDHVERALASGSARGTARAAGSAD